MFDQSGSLSGKEGRSRRVEERKNALLVVEWLLQVSKTGTKKGKRAGQGQPPQFQGIASREEGWMKGAKERQERTHNDDSQPKRPRKTITTLSISVERKEGPGQPAIHPTGGSEGGPLTGNDDRVALRAARGGTETCIATSSASYSGGRGLGGEKRAKEGAPWM